MRRSILAVALATASLAAAGADVRAAGGGPGTDAGRIGIEPVGGGGRWVTLAIQEQTVLARLEPGGRGVLAYRPLRGFHTIPAVALDGTPTGLSADGRTLVLQRGTHGLGGRTSQFTVVDARRMQVRGAIRLRGSFTLDAVSPDGRLIYFIEYTHPRDITRYAVRVYDLDRRRLRPKPIIDRYEPDEVMRGMALTRATSADGRWEYTLYSGTGEHPEPFVHALDTARAEARCIDLHDVASGDPGTMTLALGPGGGELTVSHLDEPTAVIDTKTFEVRKPRDHADHEAVAPPPARRGRAEEASSWPLAAVAAIVVLLVAGGLHTRGRRSRAPSPSPTL